MKLNKEYCKKCKTKVNRHEVWKEMGINEKNWVNLRRVVCPLEHKDCPYNLEHTLTGNENITRCLIGVDYGVFSANYRREYQGEFKA